MKTQRLILLTACILALQAPSCTTAERQQLASNAVKDGEAAGLGYLVGGKAGAVVGLTAQVIKNNTRTSGKNPGAPVTR